MDKINFQDIEAEHINRYQLVRVPGTTDQYDVIPVRGTVTNEGTPVRALELNQLQENIEGGFLPINGGTLTGPLTTRDIVPAESVSYYLGQEGKRFITVYAVNGNFGTSLTLGGNNVWHAGNLAVASGTWTPNLCDSGGSAISGVSYSAQLGTYSRIGKLVQVSFKVQVSSTSSTGSGTRLYLGRLPYKPSLGGGDCDVPIMITTVTATGYQYATLRLYNNNVVPALQMASISGSSGNLNKEHIKAGTTITGSVSYTCLD